MAKSRTAPRKPTTTASVPASAPPQRIRQLSVEEVAELVKAWDAARTELKAAGDAAAGVQAELDALGPDVDRTQLEGSLALVKERVTTAEAAIAALTPPPQGVTLPEAATSNTEGTAAAAATTPAAPAAAAAETALAAGAEGSLTQPATTNTTPSDSERQEGDGAGIGAGTVAANGLLSGERDDLNVADAARAEFQWQLEKARSMTADGSVQEGLDFLLERRAEVTLMAALTVEFGAALDREIAVLSSPTAGPITAVVNVKASVDSRWRIGREFTREAVSFQPGQLTADDLETLQGDPLLSVTVLE